MADKVLWRPNLMVNTIADIDFEALPPEMEAIIFDVDNTWASPLLSLDVPVKLREAAHRARRRFPKFPKMYLLSNMVFRWPQRERRIRRVQSMIDADGHYCAYWPQLKPNPAPYLAVLEQMRARAETTVMVGDQLRTDILGGNRLGMFTIKVEPLGWDPWWVWWKRRWENRLIASWEQEISRSL